jgi:chemotaxis receptor (MCP) glutamine deamidase CheD
MTVSLRAHGDRVLHEVTIYIGDVYAGGQPTLVKTLLGSCISVCLWDPDTGVGGMNHFMLPRAVAKQTEECSRFGIHAMDLLIGAIMKAGGDRRRLRAKVFGGGHVLGIPESEDSVPRQNINFIREFMRLEGFPVLGADVGGHSARQVTFETHSGRAMVKRLRSTRARVEVAAAEEKAGAPRFGEVTLF